MSMSPEQQQLAIEAWCGWTTKTRQNCYEGKYTVWLKDGKPSSLPIPDYLNDLNAMHEAEKGLKDDQIRKYCSELWNAVCLSPEAHIGLIHATASQRAEALLRTIGKWVEI